MEHEPPAALRRGWSTGACATAAASAAFEALATGRFPDPVTIVLPGGQRPSFALLRREFGDRRATVSVIKDAGDDPDVTHGAEIVATLRPTAPGTGVTFVAGAGVGTITKPGLPLPPGEPAINPKPRGMMVAAVAALARRFDRDPAVEIEIGVTDGEALAERTWNPRLGIVGGLSILGTTGVVIPYSCSAWIHSIHRGIDVARATGLRHVAGTTGRGSESAVRRLYRLDDGAMIDMGDFAGGMLKYLRRHPVPRVTVGGGFGKLAKLAQGALDLHSARSQVDLAALARLARTAGARPRAAAAMAEAGSAGEVLGLARAEAVPLADAVAAQARRTALDAIGAGAALDVVVVDRDGAIAGRAGP